MNEPLPSPARPHVTYYVTSTGRFQGECHVIRDMFRGAGR